MEQASTSTSAVRPLPERITRARAAIVRLEQRQEQLRGGIDRKIQPARTLLARLLSEQTRSVLTQGDVPDQTFDLLLDDESYKNDANFAPSALDTERRDAFLSRNASIAQVKHDMWVRVGGMNYWGYRVTNGQELKDDIQRKIDPYRAMGRFGKWWNREKLAALEAEMQKLQKEIVVAPEKYAASKTAYAVSEAELQKYPEQQSYDRLLQFETAVRFLPRSQQAILVSYDNTQETFTLHLPSTPTDTDFTQTLSFTIDSRELSGFTELLGNAIKTDENFAIEDCEIYNKAFDDVLVPFPLEVVIDNGEERVRIPKAVWGRFGQSANRD